MRGDISKLQHFALLCAAFGVVLVDPGSLTSCDRWVCITCTPPSAPGICKPASAQRIPRESKNTG
jgi:hypothetical protein